jgi:hypothetical protein
MRLGSAGQSIEAAKISDRNQRFQIKHSLDAVHRSTPRVRQSDAPANQFPFRLGAPAKSSAFHLTVSETAERHLSGPTESSENEWFFGAGKNRLRF